MEVTVPVDVVGEYMVVEPPTKVGAVLKQVRISITFLSAVIEGTDAVTVVSPFRYIPVFETLVPQLVSVNDVRVEPSYNGMQCIAAI